MRQFRKLLSLQLVRFLLVGILNTGFSYSIYAGLMYFGLNYVMANFLALILGIFFSFRTQGSLVFRNHNNRLIFRFAAAWLLIFLINIGLISLIIRCGFNAYFAGAAALVPITIISYLIQKFFVFGATTSSPPSISSKLDL